ncbi:hypothetical protein OIU74_022677 [Salix koriyanagi]|uniref:Uncharacterized protein n=1 Tax=Salix koriyanagi TaxID=2511006 RepID=A0A9Q0WMD1_9ROSI|nr:hypothetical protein OIU74_022677 [Salix koriyanagi]
MALSGAEGFLVDLCGRKREVRIQRDFKVHFRQEDFDHRVTLILILLLASRYTFALSGGSEHQEEEEEEEEGRGRRRGRLCLVVRSDRLTEDRLEMVEVGKATSVH